MALSRWEYPGESEQTWRRVRHKRAGDLIVAAGGSTALAGYASWVMTVNTAPGATMLLLLLGLPAVSIALALVFRRRPPDEGMWALLSPNGILTLMGGAGYVLWTLMGLWKPVLGPVLGDHPPRSLGIGLLGLGMVQVAVGSIFDDTRRSYRPLVWIVSTIYLAAFPIGTAIGGYVLWILLETWKPLAPEGRAA